VDLQSLRNYVRAQLDVDDEELPDSILNVYFQEAFERTLAADNRWPRYEYSWELTKAEGEDSIVLPPDLNLPSLMSVLSVTDGYQMTMLDHIDAERMFPSQYDYNGGQPVYYSIWQRQVWLWPRVDTASEYALRLRGYRQPAWSNVASAAPDLDERLHITLCYYAIALAYAAQEDEILEGQYMSRWDRDLRTQMKAILESVHNQPLILHGGSPIAGFPGFVVVLPES